MTVEQVLNKLTIENNFMNKEVKFGIWFNDSNESTRLVYGKLINICIDEEEILVNLKINEALDPK